MKPHWDSFKAKPVQPGSLYDFSIVLQGNKPLAAMNEQQVAQYWNNNAETWTKLARSGYDIYRDGFNTPAFLEMLPDVQGLNGLDIGCGEGGNTRLVAKRGALMQAVDIAEKFVAQAQAAEQAHPLRITYQVASASQLPFADQSFDFATSFMCLMDMPDPATALKEAHRVLRPGGFLQFNITHPCYATPHRRNLRDANGTTYAIEIGGYFHFTPGRIDEWIFTAMPPEEKAHYAKFKIPVYNWTLSQWVEMITGAGFILEKLNEPHPSDEVVAQYPDLQDAQVLAYFLQVRCRKPAHATP